jgi:murein DD-endopeptidase MepM/ murein hydrolase activator NlpD
MAAKPLHLLLALGSLVSLPLVGVPLVLAQTEAAAPEAPAAPSQPDAVPVPQPAAAAAPIAAPPPPPPLPVRVAPTATARPEPLQPGVEETRSRPPVRFDASLDALVRDRVISPNERVRVRGGLVMPQNAGLREQACISGALSAQECAGGGVVVVGRGRFDGGSFSTAGGLGQAAGGERYGIDAAPLAPITVPVGALLAGAGGSFRLTDVFRVTPRPSPIAGNGNARLLFPLIGSAVTTSNFGWRLHPVMGSWLMHAGRDLAAPEGTPVVASLTGRVVSSGVAGGYGLAVEIEHERPRRRTLYGHLSELYVKEGDLVRQGEVIGRVGSTGLSTGPHLHFELRLPQDGGWVATDPGDLDPGGGSMIAGLPGLAGLLQGGRAADGSQSDAVAMLMGQLIETLERPRSPLLLPNATPSSSTPPAVPPARPPADSPTPGSAPPRRG